MCLGGQPLGSYTIDISLIVETAITPDFILRKPWGIEQSTSPEPKPCSSQATVCAPVFVCLSAWVGGRERQREKSRGKERGSTATEENSRGLAEGRERLFFFFFLSVHSSRQSLLKWLCRVMALGSSETFPCLSAGVSEQYRDIEQRCFVASPEQ